MFPLYIFNANKKIDPLCLDFPCQVQVFVFYLCLYFTIPVYYSLQWICGTVIQCMPRLIMTLSQCVQVCIRQQRKSWNHHGTAAQPSHVTTTTEEGPTRKEVHKQLVSKPSYIIHLEHPHSKIEQTISPQFIYLPYSGKLSCF